MLKISGKMWKIILWIIICLMLIFFSPWEVLTSPSATASIEVANCTGVPIQFFWVDIQQKKVDKTSLSVKQNKIVVIWVGEDSTDFNIKNYHFFAVLNKENKILVPPIKKTNSGKIQIFLEDKKAVPSENSIRPFFWDENVSLREFEG